MTKIYVGDSVVQVGRVRFDSGDLAVEVDLGDGPPVQTQGFGGWEEIERTRKKSITRWKGRQPYKFTIPLFFDGLATGQSVEYDIRKLERLAEGDRSEPPALVVNTGGLMPHDYHDEPELRWVIDGLEPGDTVLNNQGERIRSAITVTILEYNAGPMLKEGSAARRWASNPAGPQKGAKVKRYTVKKGDTLQSIAKEQLRDAKRWKDIAKLNKIRDPRSLKVGQVLRLP